MSKSKDSNIEKQILLSASQSKQKYYFNPEYDRLPEGIREKLRATCVLLAEKTRGVVTIGFHSTGDMFFDIRGEKDDPAYDEIGAGLELKELEDDNKEMFTTMKLWYLMYKTEYGELFRKVLELNNKGIKDEEEIINTLTSEYGHEVKGMIEEILDTI